MKTQDAVKIILNVVDYNAATKPKPFHMNKDLMTTALKMERGNG